MCSREQETWLHWPCQLLTGAHFQRLRLRFLGGWESHPHQGALVHDEGEWGSFLFPNFSIWLKPPGRVVLRCYFYFIFSIAAFIFAIGFQQWSWLFFNWRAASAWGHSPHSGKSGEAWCSGDVSDTWRNNTVVALFPFSVHAVCSYLGCLVLMTSMLWLCADDGQDRHTVHCVFFPANALRLVVIGPR